MVRGHAAAAAAGDTLHTGRHCMPHCLHLFPLVSCHAVTADLEPRLRLVRCLGRCLPWDHPRSTEETRPRSPHLAPPSPHGRSCAEADPARRRWWRGQDIGRWLRRRRRLRSRRQGWGQEVASLGRGGCGDGAGGGSAQSQGGHLPVAVSSQQAEPLPDWPSPVRCRRHGSWR